jgi:glucose uptake protein
MILPTTYESALLLTFLTMLCWGSWANTTKMTGKWRFELFYFDYAAGVLVAATALALTFGEMGPELSFQDNLMIARKQALFFGFGAGVTHSGQHASGRASLAAWPWRSSSVSDRAGDRRGVEPR